MFGCHNLVSHFTIGGYKKETLFILLKNSYFSIIKNQVTKLYTIHCFNSLFHRDLIFKEELFFPLPAPCL